MPTPRLSAEKCKAVQDLLSQGKTTREITQLTGVSAGGIYNVRSGISRPAEPAKAAEPVGMSAEIRKLLKSGPLSDEQIADALDCGPAKVRAALAEMQALGSMLHKTVDGKYDLLSSFHLEPSKHEVATAATTRLGITTDNHLCNRHARLDVLNAAYDHFEREGITRALNAGNMVDGEARFNKTELIVRPGMDAQCDYAIDEFPQRKGIITEFICGDDHEGWYQQREGVEFGRYLQLRAEQQGRHDLKYLGYGECDIALRHGTGSAVLRLVHPGGGSSYAISYTDQKRVESYQGGEKPQIEVAGHYHKFNYGFPREVHTLQAGCTCDQTMFMRKKRLQAHVGYCIINITQGEAGEVTRFSVEWFPFFDRGYYEKRW